MKMTALSRITTMPALSRSYIKLIILLILFAFIWAFLSNVSEHHPVQTCQNQNKASQGSIDEVLHDPKYGAILLKMADKLSHILNITHEASSLAFKVNIEPLEDRKEVVKLKSKPYEEDEEDDTYDEYDYANDKNFQRVRSVFGVNGMQKSRPTVKPFSVAMTASEKSLLLDLAHVLAKMCIGMNMTYFMYGGTLLGSWRHHDIIQWDDDIDIVMNITERDEIYSALYTLYPKYAVVDAGPRLKFFSRQSMKTSRYRWKWPYVDLHFFDYNDTHIWDSAREFKKFVYKRTDIFPTHLRPLNGLRLSAPRDTYAYLKNTYQNPQCETHWYSHKYEDNRISRKVSKPCSKFKDSLPFVHRSADEGGVKETLLLQGNIIHSLVVPEPKYAVTKPYTLQLANESA